LNPPQKFLSRFSGGRVRNCITLFFTLFRPFLGFGGSFLTPFRGLFDTFGGFLRGSYVLFVLFGGSGGVFFWFSGRVASGRSQLLIPGFRHAHTLQLLKNI